MPLRKQWNMMKSMAKKRHPMIVVKVNAPVDEGIAPLVMAFSELPEFLTVDSCQGGNGLPAYVCLKYSGQYRGADEDELRVFSRLAKALAAKYRGEGERGYLYTLRLEWYSGDFPLGQIKCAPEDVPRLAKLVRSVADNHLAKGLLRGRQHKVLHS